MSYPADDSSLAWYLNQAGRYALLTADQELLLGRQVQQWQAIADVKDPTPAQRKLIRCGKRAKKTFFNANLRLVVSVAKRYARNIRQLEMIDLVQEGCIGLDRAIDKFDPERGYKFSTYAYWWVRQSITRAISQQDRTVRLPINAIDCLRKLRDWAPIFLRDNHRMPSPQECADYCGVTVRVMEGYLTHSNGCTSLDAVINPGKEGQTSCLVEMIEASGPTPMDIAELTDSAFHLDKWMEALNERERKVLELRWGINDKQQRMLTQTQIGDLMGCTRQAAQQTEHKAMRKLRRIALQGIAA